MNRNPEVSVVMSVYNGASTLATTMDSILSQEGVEFEFIVVNDGSTDDTSEILDGYARCDPRVRIIHHQENTGLTRGLIRGCAAANGDFIARQDAGDIALAGRLKGQVDALKDYAECVFVSCWTQFVGPKDEFLYISQGTGLARQPIRIFSTQGESGVIDGPTSHPSVMFRKKQYSLCGGYRPEFYFGQDWDLWYRLASLGTFYMLQKTLCVCRITSSAISGQHKQAQEKFAQLSKKAMLLRRRGVSDEFVLAEAKEIRSLLRRQITRREKAAADYFIGKCLLANRDKAAIQYLVKAIKEHPLYLKAWIGLLRSVFCLGTTAA
jgi:glycosyltransferase involved in cell wall biosynthesis